MNSCPVCRSNRTRIFFEQRGVPVREGYLAPTRSEAVNCDLGDIILAFCSDCTHVWNDAFDAERLKFDPQYDVSMFHSASYRTYIDQAIDRLKQRYDLAGKTALEIACGKGDFLRALIAHGFSQAIGFDPTFVEASLSENDRAKISAHRAFYDESRSSLKIDLVACRSALQYFREPRPFLQSIRRTLNEQPNTIVYFEVPNGDETFARQIVWNIAYEHGCFYSAASLSRLFNECGFEVLDVLPGLGGSQLELEARIASKPIRVDASIDLSAATASVESFAATRASRVAEWSDRLRAERQEGRRVALWGAGARAISFLCAVDNADVVTAAVDINPARQGRFLTKTGVEVISPERLAHEEIDLVIATNPNFAKEIESQIRSMGMKCGFDVLR
jgi:SAM-dependent methyltransferase